jgi:hypothetical protein
VSWTSIPGILGDMTGAAPEPKQCEWVTLVGVHIKSIGRMRIDRSEWENENGAWLCDRKIPCRYVADRGKKFCPRHEMEAAMQREPGCIVPRPTAEIDDALGVPAEWREKHHD